MTFNDDSVALEGDVALVRRKEKGEKVVLNANRVSQGNLPIIPILLFVWEDKFTEMEEGVETREQLGKEEEIVM
jgi:hypothetical protein